MTSEPSIAALIVAAGRGKRAGGNVPKQWQPLNGKRVIDQTILLHGVSALGMNDILM